MADQSASNPSHVYALPVGTDLFEFRIEQVLGHGGFGITYLATDTNLDEHVAIKEYMPSEIAVRTSDSTVRAKTRSDDQILEEGLNSFLEEARTLARCRHRNIVRVRRFFRLNGTAYIVLEYEYGQTLSQYLETLKMDNDKLRDLLWGVLDGLDQVHALATLHRDLKPSNIIVRPDMSPVLIDFGAARNFQSRSSASVTAIATAGYSAPEQYIGGQQGPWTDIYALGAVAYRIVSGTTPPDSLRRLRKDPLVPASSMDVPYDSALLETIDWMLKVEESDRPISVDAVRDSLAGTGCKQNTPGYSAPTSGQKPEDQRAAISDDAGKTADDLSIDAPPRPHQLVPALKFLSFAALIGIAIWGAYFLGETNAPKTSPASQPTTIASPSPKTFTSPVAPAETPAPPPKDKDQTRFSQDGITPTYYLNRISEAWYDREKLTALLDQCGKAADCTKYMTVTINNRLRTLD